MTTLAPSWFEVLQKLKTKNLVRVVYLGVIPGNYPSEQVRRDRQECQQSPQIMCLWVTMGNEAQSRRDPLRGHSWEQSLCARGSGVFTQQFLSIWSPWAVLPACPSSYHSQGETPGREGRKALGREDYLQVMRWACCRPGFFHLFSFLDAHASCPLTKAWV